MSEDILKHIYNACDPYEPATAKYYLDCSAARGSSSLSQRFQRHLAFANDHCCFLLSGHIGCGKSSELVHLSRILADPKPKSPYARYFPVLLNVSEYLDDYDVTVTDILLAIVTEIADVLRRELKVELKDSYFTKRLNEIKQFFLSDTELNEGELSLPGAKAKILRLKTDPTGRENVRKALLPRMSTMLEEINMVFEEARSAVRQAKTGPGEQPYTDFVLMLDNLEKIQRIEGKAEGLESQRELFIERYAQLTGLKAHVIYTVPLRLARSDGPQLQQRYGTAPFVLPMIKVIERGSRNVFVPGIEQLHAMLAKRLHPYTLEQAFASEALDFLLTYSGGHVRNLMIFVQEACTYADDTPISPRAAHQAIQQTVRAYSTAIPERYWEKLAQLEVSSDQRIPNDDQDYLAMLENLSILEYINGDGTESPFETPEPWYAVNPIVCELGKFKAAVQNLQGQPEDKGA